VRLREQTVVDGLLIVEGRVTGVAARQVDERHAEPLAADLVVDASGRMSRTPEWLRAAGYEPVVESVVNAHLGYASRLYGREPHDGRSWRAMFVQAEPPERPRAGIAFPIEGDRWMVTLCGGGKDYPPADEAGFAEFARSLPCSGIHELIVSSKPVGSTASYRRTENRWRHYERLRRFPQGFLVFGDAAAAFNPVYGQGISVAAGSAMALRHCLATADRNRLARRFHERQAAVIRTAWTLATGEDAYYRHVEGAGLGAVERFMHWYVLQVMRASTHDTAARHTLLRVFGMVAPPTSLFGMAMLWKVLKEALFGASHSEQEHHESDRDAKRGVARGQYTVVSD
jgi:flavin-dependent dehydrogenase